MHSTQPHHNTAQHYQNWRCCTACNFKIVRKSLHFPLQHSCRTLPQLYIFCTFAIYLLYVGSGQCYSISFVYQAHIEGRYNTFNFTKHFSGFLSGCTHAAVTFIMRKTSIFLRIMQNRKENNNKFYNFPLCFSVQIYIIYSYTAIVIECCKMLNEKEVIK